MFKEGYKFFYLKGYYYLIIILKNIPKSYSILYLVLVLFI